MHHIYLCHESISKDAIRNCKKKSTTEESIALIGQIKTEMRRVTRENRNNFTIFDTRNVESLRHDDGRFRDFRVRPSARWILPVDDRWAVERGQRRQT